MPDDPRAAAYRTLADEQGLNLAHWDAEDLFYAGYAAAEAKLTGLGFVTREMLDDEVQKVARLRAALVAIRDYEYAIMTDLEKLLVETAKAALEDTHDA